MSTDTRSSGSSQNGMGTPLLNAFRLDGKTAIVTGASRGLGQAIAVALAQAGADIVSISTTSAQAETAAAVRACGRRFEAVACNLAQADAAALEELLDGIERSFAGCRILVNNAGIIRRSPAVDYSDEDWQAVIDTNLTAVFRLCRAMGRRMIAGGGGKIINLASLLSFTGGINVPAYSASKGAVMQLTKALANEWSARNVQVNAIAPGYFATDNTAALRGDERRNAEILARIPTGRWGNPADLMGAAVFLASAASDYVTGHTLVVDGGFSAR